MNLSTQLKNKAQEILNSSPELVAISMLKQAGLTEEQARLEVAQHEMEKQATSALVAGGIDYDEAVKLVKVANVKVAELDTFKVEKSDEEVLAEELFKFASEVEALEKAASEVQELRTKVAELEEILESTPEIVDVPEPITKLAKSGDFTNEDLEALMKLPSDTLTKIASTAEEPWRMGKAASTGGSNLDPLTAWLIGD